jgi:hypothetical protein
MVLGCEFLLLDVELVFELDDDFLGFGGFALDKFVQLVFELFVVAFPLL